MIFHSYNISSNAMSKGELLIAQIVIATTTRNYMEATDN